MEHGTSTAYNKGCRCRPCKDSRAAYARTWRQQNPNSGKVARDCIKCGQSFMAWPDNTRHGRRNVYCSRACYGNLNGAAVRSSVYRPGHPLAGVKGTVLAHRHALYEAIGPGTHACRWCERPITWVVRAGGGRGSGYAQPEDLIVDHIDNDPRNNSLENLVPACNACNVLRGLISAWQAKTGRPVSDLHP